MKWTWDMFFFGKTARNWHSYMIRNRLRGLWITYRETWKGLGCRIEQEAPQSAPANLPPKV